MSPAAAAEVVDGIPCLVAAADDVGELRVTARRRALPAWVGFQRYTVS